MKNESKQTESQEAIELFQMQLEDQKIVPEQAKLIVSNIGPIKKMYGTRFKELQEEILAAIPKPDKAANVDDLIAANEERKTREYQNEVRLHTLDRLDRQVKMGKVNSWEESTLIVFQAMHAMAVGSVLAK